MNKSKKEKPLSKYLRFSSIAIQMGVTIYLANLLGEWLDIKYINENELYTKICTLIGVFIAMFSVILQVSKISKQK
ncbi:AtpZ/AtpI family protein [Tenacibaculum aestuariivivum]|uniref:AtpZ/AtpI family protein n=1 Tax=Tenacibaculum aestuariivivum TaxID=2006131 RepID=UPI003AB5E7BA